jgi:hypothetical protein
MSLLNLILPVFQQPDSTEDPKVNNALIAIQNWANGNVDFSNFAPNAGLIKGPSAHNLSFLNVVDQPTCGPTGSGLGGGLVSGLAFPTACVYAWATFCLNYSDSGRTVALGLANFSYFVTPSGTGVNRTFVNNSGGYCYPQIGILALGY